MYYYRRYYLDAVWTRQATSLQMTTLQKAPLEGGGEATAALRGLVRPHGVWSDPLIDLAPVGQVVVILRRCF